ncbi:MAG: ROK family protein [Candidatus Neomarinimicrobiota bacterium]
MDNKNCSLGVDIGGTNTVFGLVSDNGSIFKKKSFLTESAKGPTLLFNRIFEKLKLWDKEFEGELILKNIGIGVPNGNYYSGMVVDPPNLGERWSNVDLVTLIKSYINIPVKITNDANAAAIGEKFYGAAKQMKDVVLITLGTGLGSGIIVNNAVLYGYDGFAGELGHIIVEPGGRSAKNTRAGALEMYVSAKGIKYTINEYLDKFPNDVTLNELKACGYDGKRMDEAFDNGVAIVKEIYEFTGNMLGFGLAQAATILSPEAFIFYGGLSNAKHRILDYAKKSMDENLLSFQKGKIKLLSSKLPDGEAGILGASCLHKSQ